MTEPKSERIITPLPKSLVDAIDDFRFANRLPSRAEAMRRILEAGLAALAAMAQDPNAAPELRARKKPGGGAAAND
jgi:metal-responsive CopG/Arc/MetJ family transcriptional regulator